MSQYIQRATNWLRNTAEETNVSETIISKLMRRDANVGEKILESLKESTYVR
jgi:hypothetical protein